MKPKYNFFSNTKFALQGLGFMLKREKAFKIELCVIIPALILNFFLPITLSEHLILTAVLFIILIAECFNSAVEACVDLITDEWHELAKIAKDCASGGVALSVALGVILWGFVLINLWLNYG